MHTINIIIIILSLTGLAGLFVTMLKQDIPLHASYPIVAACFGLAFMLLIPLYAPPDERAHIVTSYSISSKMMLEKKPATKHRRVYVRQSDLEHLNMDMDDQGLEASDYEYYYSTFDDPLTDDTMVKSKLKRLKTRDYQYILSAAGITIGRLLHLGIVPVLMLGRLFNLAFFIAGMTYAIRRMPAAKTMVYLYALLPMMIQQGMSFSRDISTIIFTIIVLSETLYLYHEIKLKKSLSFKDVPKWEWFILCACALLLLPIKSMAYSPIAFLPVILLVPWRKLLAGRKRELAIALGVCALIIIGAAAMKMPSLLKKHAFSKDVSKNYIRHLRTYGYTVPYLLARPKLFLKIIYHTATDHIYDFITTMIVGPLGSFNIPLPRFALNAYIIILALGTAKRKEEGFLLKLPIRALFITISVVICAMTCLHMLFTYTPVGSDYVLGVQGRYFLPLFPLMAFGLQTQHIEVSQKTDRILVFASGLILVLCELFIMKSR